MRITCDNCGAAIDKDDAFAKFNVVVRKGADGKMEVGRQPIPEMPGSKAVRRSRKRNSGPCGKELRTVCRRSDIGMFGLK